MDKFAQVHASVEVAKLAAKLQAESHLLFEIVMPNPNGSEVVGAHANPICGTLSQAVELALVHAQLATILERVRYATNFVLPAFWDELESRWQTIQSNGGDDNIFNQTPGNLISFALFIPVHDTRILGLVCHSIPKPLATQMLPLFHSEGARLIAGVGSANVTSTASVRPLNDSERNCLIWCASGKTSFEIAKILNLSEHTVNHYFSIAASKLEANNRAHAVVQALKLGVISLEECV